MRQIYRDRSTRLATASCALLVGSVVLSCGMCQAYADEWDRPPISYSTAPERNRVADLIAKLDRGEISLTFTPGFGYLKSVLEALDVPISSQVLVFSKTSLQRDRIGPTQPRAIYFNDDVYVGFCQNGAVMELSAADARLGAAFYTLDQEATQKPRFVRQTESCLVCHSSSSSYGYPGHLVRSVYPDSAGQPIFSLGSHRTDHSSPISERWGGWYVTGTSGPQRHLGNLIVDAANRREPPDNVEGVNRTRLDDRFSTESYLTGHSDIVALLVLEHQVEMHNRITRANFQARQALSEEAEMNQILGQAKGTRSEGIRRRLQNAAEQLLEWMLFCREAMISSPIQGTSDFAKVFAASGPRDDKGRSLRDFDLHRRIFRFPCSYLIYSKSFDELPAEVRDTVYQRLGEILTGKDQSERFAHLSNEDRRNVFEILMVTKPDLAAFWNSHSS